MKVRELINELEKHDGDMDVTIRDFGNHYRDIEIRLENLNTKLVLVVGDTEDPEIVKIISEHPDLI